jgi:hypothetical protein
MLMYLAIKYSITDFPVPVGYSTNMADFLLCIIKNISAFCSGLGFISIDSAIWFISSTKILKVSSSLMI